MHVPLSMTPCAPIVSSSLMQRYYGFRQSASHVFKRIASCNLCNVLSDFVSRVSLLSLLLLVLDGVSGSLRIPLLASLVASLLS